MKQLEPAIFMNLLETDLIFPSIEISLDTNSEIYDKNMNLSLVFCPIDCDFQMKVIQKT